MSAHRPLSVRAQITYRAIDLCLQRLDDQTQRQTNLLVALCQQVLAAVSQK